MGKVGGDERAVKRDGECLFGGPSAAERFDALGRGFASVVGGKWM